MEKYSHLYTQELTFKNFKIINCETCGFRHIYPLLERSEVEKFYREKYYREIQPFPYSQVNPEYIEKVLDEVNRNNDYYRIYQKVESLLQTDVRRMLDIGCGNDLLTKFFQNQGWESFAIEPNQDAANYLNLFNLNVYNCPVEEIETIEIKNISFINLRFVLEHIMNPYRVLQQLYNLMTAGGIIRVVVPNDFSEGQLAYLENFKEEPHWVCLPDHINYFTFESLHNLLERVGFSEVYRITNFPLEILLLSGVNYYASEEERKKVGPLVRNFENAFRNTGRERLLEQYYEALAQLGFGRAIYMYAIKK